MENRSSILVPVLAVLLVIILIIPITHMIIAPKEPDPLKSPRFELNNHSLREVFENVYTGVTLIDTESSGVTVTRSGLPDLAIFNGIRSGLAAHFTIYNLIEGNKYYGVYQFISGSIDGLFNGSWIPSKYISSTNVFTSTSQNIIVLSLLTDQSADDFRFSLYVYDLTSLGIDNLTTAQMDYWYNLYLYYKSL